MTTFLEHPWVKHVSESRYMVELLKFLSIGRKVSTILSHFKELPEEYVLGALEALESLGVVKSLDVGEEKFYVLSSQGRILLAYIEDLQKPSV